MSEEEQPMLIPEGEATSAPDTEQLDRDIASLRGLIFWVVAGLLLLSAAVNLYLWRQVKNVRNEIAAEQRQVDDYAKADPAIRDLMQRLQTFAASHPDFQPVMAKYAAAATNAAAAKK
jgi:hypothetical protein